MTKTKATAGEWGIWDQGRDDATVDKLADDSADDAITSGKPLTAAFAKGLKLSLRKYAVLADSLRNFNKLAIVSDELKGFLVEKRVPHLEFFPLEIVYEGKPLKGAKTYHLMNLLEVVDCLDEKKSYDGVNLVKLVLDPSRIPPDRSLFRIKPFAFRKVEPPKLRSPLLVQKSLIDEMRERKLVGPVWTTFKAYLQG